MSSTIRVVIFLFLSIHCLLASAQVEVVEQKRFEHEGAVATSVTPSNKVITYSIITQRGQDDQLELVSYNEKLEEEGRFQATCAEKNIFRTHALSGSGEYYFSLMIDKRREIHSIVFNTNNFEVTELYVDLERKFEPNGNQDFLGGVSTACFKNKFFILGTVKKVPCILVYNMLTGTQHLTFIPGMDKKMRVSFLSATEAAPSLQVMFFNYKRKKNRKKNFESQCYMVTHPVVFNENAWTVLGEVFYPTYRTEYRTSYVNGKPVTQTVYVFDGFAYSHAVVLQVSSELEKIRDYSFDLDIYDKRKRFLLVQELLFTHGVN